MESRKINWKKLVTLVLVLVLAWFAISKYISTQQTAYVSAQINLILEQEKVLEATAETVSKNGAPLSKSGVVTDCKLEKRVQFDKLLSSLATLNKEELTQLDKIYGGCAYYFSTLQGVAVMQFRRELDVYKKQLEVVTMLSTKVQDKIDTLEKWNSLLEIESERSRLNTELVDIQREIVTELILGNSTQSPSVQSLVKKGQEIRGNIEFTTGQTNTMRSEMFGS